MKLGAFDIPIPTYRFFFLKRDHFVKIEAWIGKLLVGTPLVTIGFRICQTHVWILKISQQFQIWLKFGKTAGQKEAAGQTDSGWAEGRQLGRRTAAGQTDGWAEGRPLGRRTAAGQTDDGWADGLRLFGRTAAGQKDGRWADGLRLGRRTAAGQTDGSPVSWQTDGGRARFRQGVNLSGSTGHHRSLSCRSGTGYRSRAAQQHLAGSGSTSTLRLGRPTAGPASDQQPALRPSNRHGRQRG